MADMGELSDPSSSTRRDLLRKAAVTGGVIWVAPAVLSTPAGAQVSGATGTSGIKDHSTNDTNPTHWECPTGSKLTTGNIGTVTYTFTATTAKIDVTVASSAFASSTYNIWENQDPGGCPRTGPTGTTLTTDGSGNGTASVTVARVSGAKNYWISLVRSSGSGNSLARSVALSYP